MDVLETTDCSCKNLNVQFKLNQIATTYTYLVTVLSANRTDPVLFAKSKKELKGFAERFFDEHILYRTAIGVSGTEWNSLDEFLETGDPSFIEL